MNVKAALTGQYRAAMAMLKQAIEKCPEDQWLDGPYPVPFWQAAYHTLYFTHLYLQQTEDDFHPWEHDRDDYHDLPWPPGSGSEPDRPYAKAEILEYWRLCNDMIDAAVDRLDLDARESGFSWHKMLPKFEHQIHNIRHIQHHAAMLSGRLRAAGADAGLRWVRSR